MNDKPTDQIARPCDLSRRIVAKWLLQLEQSAQTANYIIVLFSDGTATFEDSFSWGKLHDTQFLTWLDRLSLYDLYLEARGDDINERMSRYTRSVTLRPRTKLLLLRAARREITIMCPGEAFASHKGCRCFMHDPLAIAINQELENRYFWPVWSRFLVLMPEKRLSEFVPRTPPSAPAPESYNLTSITGSDTIRF